MLLKYAHILIHTKTYFNEFKTILKYGVPSCNTKNLPEDGHRGQNIKEPTNKNSCDPRTLYFVDKYIINYDGIHGKKCITKNRSTYAECYPYANLIGPSNINRLQPWYHSFIPGPHFDLKRYTDLNAA